MCFVCRTTDSPDSFSFKILESSTQMKVERMLIFWTVVSLFTVTLIRQIRLKFRSHFTIIVLILTGIRLLFWFNKFIENIEKLKTYFIKKNEAIKISNLANEIVIFRFLQVFLGIIVIICLVKSTTKIKSQNAIQPPENDFIN